jgi:hypothetical protein
MLVCCTALLAPGCASEQDGVEGDEDSAQTTGTAILTICPSDGVAEIGGLVATDFERRTENREVYVRPGEHCRVKQCLHHTRLESLTTAPFPPAGNYWLVRLAENSPLAGEGCSKRGGEEVLLDPDDWFGCAGPATDVAPPESRSAASCR